MDTNKYDESINVHTDTTMVGISDELGRRVRLIRKEGKISLEKFASACKFSTNVIRQIERGEKMPSLLMIVKICDNLQVSPAYLLASEIDIEKSDKEWERLGEIQKSLPESLSQIVDSVRHSMVENLKEKNVAKDEEEYGTIDRIEFGRRLKKARQEVNVSSDEIAFSSGVQPVFIRQIESGFRLPSLPVFLKICGRLNMSPTYLLGNEIKIETAQNGWEEMAEIQCNITPQGQIMIKTVLTSLLENMLLEQESN